MYTQIMHFRIYLLTREFTFSVIACERVLSEKWEKERREEKKHGITSKYARGRVHGEISLSVEDEREREYRAVGNSATFYQRLDLFRLNS